MIVWDSGICKTVYKNIVDKVVPKRQKETTPDLEKQEKRLPRLPPYEKDLPAIPVAFEMEDTGPFDSIELTEKLPPQDEADVTVLIPYTIRTGIIILVGFVVCTVVIMTVRGLMPDLPELYKFFANIWLAGTIICGIPLPDEC